MHEVFKLPPNVNKVCRSVWNQKSVVFIYVTTVSAGALHQLGIQREVMQALGPWISMRLLGIRATESLPYVSKVFRTRCEFQLYFQPRHDNFNSIIAFSAAFYKIRSIHLSLRLQYDNCSKE